MKSLFLSLALGGLLGACATYPPMPPPAYAVVPLTPDPNGPYPPGLGYGDGYPYGTPWGYLYPYPEPYYGWPGRWYDPFVVTFVCCASAPRLHHFHRFHHFHPGGRIHPPGARGPGPGGGGRGGHGGRR